MSDADTCAAHGCNAVATWWLHITQNGVGLSVGLCNTHYEEVTE